MHDDLPAFPIEAPTSSWPPAESGLTRQFVTVGKHRMSYVIGGNGPPLVLVHGLGTASFTWRFVLPVLQQRFTVYAIDMLGCGESDKTDVDYRLEALAGYLHGFLDAVGLERPIIIGHSMGGGITMMFCHLYPGRAERVVLASSGGMGREMHWLLRVSTLPGAEGVIGVLSDPRSRVPQVSRSLEQRRMRRLDQEFDATTPTMLDRFQSPEARLAFLSMLRGIGSISGQKMSALPFLSGLAVPTLLIWGAGDKTIPVTHGKEAVKLIPCAHLEIIPNCFHRPQVEAPQRFCELVLEFLDAPVWPPVTAPAPETAIPFLEPISAPQRALRSNLRWQGGNISPTAWRKLAPALAPVAIAALGVPTGMRLIRRRQQRRRAIGL
ncbi:MAG: alpha/beta fold hydrolase [Ktedonobacterales bacterium]|nr:alpha/beta fold hydrolase [Ktedonobacterales bacterium]